jgi:hypothetical protein
VVQNLEPWAPAAPRLRSDEAFVDGPAAVPPALVSTALSSQDDTTEEPAPAAHNGVDVLTVGRAEADAGSSDAD